MSSCASYERGSLKEGTREAACDFDLVRVSLAWVGDIILSTYPVTAQNCMARYDNILAWSLLTINTGGTTKTFVLS
jgi:hypothetical protein